MPHAHTQPVPSAGVRSRERLTCDHNDPGREVWLCAAKGRGGGGGVGGWAPLTSCSRSKYVEPNNCKDTFPGLWHAARRKQRPSVAGKTLMTTRRCVSPTWCGAAPVVEAAEAAEHSVNMRRTVTTFFSEGVGMEGRGGQFQLSSQRNWSRLIRVGGVVFRLPVRPSGTNSLFSLTQARSVSPQLRVSAWHVSLFKSYDISVVSVFSHGGFAAVQPFNPVSHYLNLSITPDSWSSARGRWCKAWCRGNTWRRSCWCTFKYAKVKPWNANTSRHSSKM